MAAYQHFAEAHTRAETHRSRCAPELGVSLTHSVQLVFIELMDLSAAHLTLRVLPLQTLAHCNLPLVYNAKWPALNNLHVEANQLFLRLGEDWLQ